MKGLFKEYERAFPKFKPTKSAPINPGPAVAETKSISSFDIFATGGLLTFFSSFPSNESFLPVIIISLKTAFLFLHYTL